MLNHKVNNKTWDWIQIPWDLLLPVCHGMHFLALSPFKCFGFFSIYFFFNLKKLQYNTIMHRQSKALVPNTTPLLALGLAQARILSKAFLHIPASQKGRLFLCTALNPWNSISSTQDTCTAFRATKFSLGTVPFLFHVFILTSMSAQKGDHAVFNKQKVM